MFHARTKAIIVLFLGSILIAYPAYAQYNPFVRIPGLPPSGPINLSIYLVGLYNFLVSIVGIVAVMMIIIGGMRYITAGGSTTALGDAKEIVTSAIWGLLIAIFAWIIVAAINPDVLYIKQPGTAFNKLTYLSCAKQFSPPSTCVCNDGGTPAGPHDTPERCNDSCMSENKCELGDTSCIRAGVNDTTSPRFRLDPNLGKCLCIDGKDVVPPGPTTCQAACLANNCFAIMPRIGELPLSEGDMLSRYTPQQIRAFATKDPGSDVQPWTLPEGATFVMDLDSSAVPFPPATYTYDNNADGNCDTPFNGVPGLGGNWAIFTMYQSPDPLPPVCKAIPNGEQCVSKICGTDSNGKTAIYNFHNITLY